MGLEIGIGWLTVLMFGSLAILLMAGLPLAFVTGGLACVFLFLFGDAAMLNIIPSRIFPMMTDYQLSAIPLFIFMATVLERAGIVEQLFDAIYRILGGLRGGLAAATIIAATIMAAMAGVIGATEVTMGILALPAMLRRGYNPEMACGSILAGGTLGILIPPSILAILFAVVAQQSVGELFLGAVIPGLILSGLYVIYVVGLSFAKPHYGPPLPVEERISVIEKLKLLNGLLAPIILIVLVLGVIFSGIATPVEAAGIGTFGALVVAALKRRLSWTAVRDAAITTLKATSMVLWIVFGATMFVGFYVVNGGQAFVSEMLIGTGLLLLAVPIFVPLAKTLAFDGVFGLGGVAPADVALWFGVVYMVNMQMSFLSPPFGYALFYLKSVAPPEVTMGMIFRGALPFLGLQALGLAICILFPDLILWLPKLVYGD